MSKNHPNRSTANRMTRPAPAPAKIRQAREAAELTQTQAAELVYATLRTWQNWETEEGSPEHRRMHPAIFELFQIKTRQLKLSDVMEATR